MRLQGTLAARRPQLAGSACHAYMRSSRDFRAALSLHVSPTALHWETFGVCALPNWPHYQ
jgi:hypothetical protein